MPIYPFFVDAAVYVLIAIVVVRFAKRWLASPWSEYAFTIPLVVGAGLILSLLTYPYWLVRF